MSAAQPSPNKKEHPKTAAEYQRDLDLEASHIDKFGKPESTNPFEESPLISRLLFRWLQPLFDLSRCVEFKQQHHFNNPKNLSSAEVSAAFAEIWLQVNEGKCEIPAGSKTPVRNLLKAVWIAYKSGLLLGVLNQSIGIVVEFSNAFLIFLSINQVALIDYSRDLSESSGPLWNVFFYMTIFILLRVMGALIDNYIQYLNGLTGWQISTSINSLIFSKILKKNFDRDTTFEIGEVTNLTQVDSARIGKLGFLFGYIVSLPVKIFLGIIALYYLMGSSMIPTMGVFILILAANTYIARMHEMYKSAYMEASDSRSKMIHEIFTNIKYIKLEALENIYLQRLWKLRNIELNWIYKLLFRYTLSNTSMSFSHGLFMLTLYVAKLQMSGSLTLTEAVVSNIIFGIFGACLRNIGIVAVFVIDTFVSSRRLTFFLLSEEIDKSHIIYKNPASLKEQEPVVQISSGNFYWINKTNRRLYKDEKARIGKRRRGVAKAPTDEKDPNGPAEPPKNMRELMELKGVTVVSKELNSPVGFKMPQIETPLLERNLGFTTPLAYRPKAEREAVQRMMQGGDLEVIEENAVETYEWESDCPLVLREIELKVFRGQCIGVIGKVGSGKSSLLSAILGEIYPAYNTKVTVAGTVAYVSQKPWITSSTMRNVLLLDRPLNQDRLEQCLKYSGLADDLKHFTEGLDTELGDRGLNLSGGQKTRLAIARAMYSDADIYLFDDPISALDVNVGKLVMEQGILNYLKGKTRVVATHALAYLPYFDYILVMDEGKIVEHGTYQKISQTQVYKEYRLSLEEEEDEDEVEGDEQSVNNQDMLTVKKSVKALSRRSFRSSMRRSAREFENDKLILDRQRKELRERRLSVQGMTTNVDKVIEKIVSSEDKARGTVITWKLFTRYVHLGGGWWVIGISAGIYTFKMIADLYNLWYVQYWTQQGITSEFSVEFGATLLSLLTGTTLAVFGHNLLQSKSSIVRSEETSFLMSFRFVHASLNGFLDRLPLGRVLNRFIKDLSNVDLDLPTTTGYYWFLVFTVLTDCVAAVYGSSIWVMLFFLAYFWLMLPLQKKFMYLNREISRLRSISSTPVIQSVSETAQGVVSVRVFNYNETSHKAYHKAQDEFLKNAITSDAAVRWFTVQVILYSALVLAPSIFLNIFFVRSGPGLFAFLMRYLVIVLGEISDLLNNTAQIESKMVSLERCLHFTQVSPEEGYTNLEESEQALRKGEIPPLPKQLQPSHRVWPQKGDLDIQGLRMRYRPGLPEVIKGLNLQVSHGKKVGIVGRTGAGKSTLLTCLYRQAESYIGQILFDRRDISQIDIKELRRNITVIPQETYLFNDSVRANLDPLNIHTDKEIQQVLKEIDMWEKFEQCQGLSTMIEKGGSDLSQGERQLLCLARAFLRKNKLVLIDEATANIDSQSEVLIQKLMLEKFKDCTVLMIAHRLNTVIRCDKVLVLDQGTVAEYGYTEQLRQDPNSLFYKMLNTYEAMQQALS